MQCPITTFDCISCDERCLLQERRQQADPFRRGNDLRTCDAELIRYGMAEAPSCNEHEPIYDDGAGWICRHCGTEMDEEDEA